jgi:hypothetical protein
MGPGRGRAEKGKIERNRRNREVFDFYKMNSRPVKKLRGGNIMGAIHRICLTQFTRSIHKDIEKKCFALSSGRGIEVEIKEILMIHTDFPILVPPFEACI